MTIWATSTNGLTELQLLIEVDKIAKAKADVEQFDEQDQQVRAVIVNKGGHAPARGDHQ